VAKLNQIIAIEKGIKSRVYGELTEINKALQKPDIFNGFSKTYQKIGEDDEELPAERKKVQAEVPVVFKRVEKLMGELMKVTARKDWSNTNAKANVRINGVALLEEVPVSYLLFLEKQLTDLRTMIGNLPVLDDSENWTKDVNSGLYRADETKTHRTKKVQKPIVLFPATAEHPAQTQLITQDVIAGHWTNVKQSGALPRPEKEKLLARVDQLLQAIKVAREEANNAEEIISPDVGQAIFKFLLAE
jgi:hypothetical protein